MSSYASYCQDQGIDCARRARVARSLEVANLLAKSEGFAGSGLQNRHRRPVVPWAARATKFPT
jgi:hypothetical protein